MMRENENLKTKKDPQRFLNYDSQKYLTTDQKNFAFTF